MTIDVFNILGQQVRTLVDEEQPRGLYKVIWDGKDNSRRLASTGIYLYRLRVGEYTQVKKMLLLK